jgi:pyruvate kinase
MTSIFKRTKILATLGPKTFSQEMVNKLSAAGVNGFRLNFSHGDHPEKDDQISWIRKSTEVTGKHVAIVQDLQGPKIRLGMLNENVVVKKGDILTLDFASEHQGLTLPVQYNLAQKTKVGETLYIFDGKVRTTIQEIASPTAIRVLVANDGILMSKKGINLPDTDFGGDILTEKDMRDIDFGATRDIDYVAISFVQNASDINNLRRILEERGSKAKLIAKVETKAAILEENLEAIVKASDGVMVARGDLAVEAGAEVVPVVQRRIVSLCRQHGKLCIVATQMMSSMVDSPEPTRADVSDVANAVMQGADVLMLSDETANGNYPLETVAVMKKVIMYTQRSGLVYSDLSSHVENVSQSGAISASAVHLAKELKADIIVAETKRGVTAEYIAANRPQHSIICVTSEARTAQQLSLRYASRCYVRPDGAGAGYDILKELKDGGLFGTETLKAVVVSGRQPGVPGATDTIKVYEI